MSVQQRLAALETVVKARWGEYVEPDPGAPVSDDWAESPEGLMDIVNGVKNEMSKLTDALARVTQEVAETQSAFEAYKTANDATIALLRENAADPEAINQIADTLQATQDRMASAVVANTAVASDAVTGTGTPDPVNAPPSAEETAAEANSQQVNVPEALTNGGVV